jgi:phosphoserine phosphatase
MSGKRGVEQATPAALIARLESMLSKSGAETNPLLVFDGDGTLWSGDVGEEVFEAAVKSGLILDVAAEALRALASAHGFDASGTPTSVADGLYRAYLRNEFAERPVTEMMVWCYAGWHYDAWANFSRDVLRARTIASRYNPSVVELLGWAASRGLRAIVISASPQPAVEAAVEALGLGPDDVIAGRPRLDSSRVLPELASPLPYGADKVRAGRAAVGSTPWLAVFGDSDFDFEMLAEAEQPVVVHPKPALRARLRELRGVVELVNHGEEIFSGKGR